MIESTSPGIRSMSQWGMFDVLYSHNGSKHRIASMTEVNALGLLKKLRQAFCRGMGSEVVRNLEK